MLHPTHYINAGQYMPGQMVDSATVTQFQKLEFADGTTQLGVTITPRNTYVVTSLN